MKKSIILIILLLFVNATAGDKKTIAVLDLIPQNVSANNASVLSEKLRNEFLKTGKYTVVERENMKAILNEQGFQQTGCTSNECVVKVGQLIGVTHMIAGKIGRLNKTYYISIRLIDVEKGVIITSADDAESTSLEQALRDTMGKLAIKIIENESKIARKASLDSRFIEVSTSSEFIKAIQSDVVIILKEGTYNISNQNETYNPNIKWINEFDGYCPIVKSVNNLKLIGKGKVSVLINPAYGWVLEFDTCRNIEIENITFGHTKPGYCLGGVLKFSLTESIKIRDSVLFGSGTYGIELNKVYNFSLDNSIVKDCTYGLLVINDTKDARFSKSRFVNTGEFDLVSVRNSNNISFISCLFKENKGSNFFDVSVNNKNIFLSSCDIIKNKGSFTGDIKNLKMLKCKFSGNRFKDYKDSYLNGLK